MELHFFLLLPVIVVIAWMLVFYVTERYHQLHDRILLVMLTCCAATCYITLRAIADGCDDYTFIFLDNTETLLGLSICPSFYLYMRTIAHDVRWRGWYWWLYAPGVVLCVVGTILSVALGWDKILMARIDHFSLFIPNTDSTMGKLYEFVDINLFNVTLEVMAIVLIGLSIFYLARYYRGIGDYYANVEESSALRMNYFLFTSIVLFLSIFLITIFIQPIVDKGITVCLCISLWLSFLSWCICYNGYKIVLTKQLVEVVSLENPQTEDVQEKKKSESQKLPEHLENLLSEKVSAWENQEDKRYCKEGLTLTEVARDMQINPRVLSTFVNKHFGMNFNRWINTMRIEEAKRLFLSSPEIKIGYVSAVCGFADQAAFSKVFRMIEGCSPGEYIYSNASSSLSQEVGEKS